MSKVDGYIQAQSEALIPILEKIRVHLSLQNLLSKK